MSKVSVIIPTYNSAKYISRAVDSILNQTHKDTEIIIVDDGSTDNTRIIIDKYVQNFFDKIVHIYQKNNSGDASAPRNNGIRHARGDYIAFLDSDDIWMPTKLEKQLRMIMNKPEYSLVFNDCQIRTSGKVIHDSFLKTVAHFAFTEEIYLDDILEGNFIYPSTVLVKRDCFDGGLLFNTTKKVRCNEDFEIWLKIIKKHRIGFLNEVLTIKYLHEFNISNSLVRQFLGELKVISDFLLEDNSETYRKIAIKRIGSIYFNLAYYYLENKKKWDSFRYFLKSMKFKHFLLKSSLYIIFLMLPTFGQETLRSFKRFFKKEFNINYSQI